MLLTSPPTYPQRRPTITVEMSPEAGIAKPKGKAQAEEGLDKPVALPSDQQILTAVNKAVDAVDAVDGVGALAQKAPHTKPV